MTAGTVLQALSYPVMGVEWQKKLGAIIVIFKPETKNQSAGRSAPYRGTESFFFCRNSVLRVVKWSPHQSSVGRVILYEEHRVTWL